LDLYLQGTIALRLLFAFVLGALLGYERRMQQKPAGSRTHALVCLGSAIFMIISIYGFTGIPGQRDPARIAAQVVTGMGFIGAGAIWKERSWVVGLTTASTLWVSSAIGLAVGAGMYLPAIIGTFLSYLALELHKFEKIFSNREKRAEKRQLINNLDLEYLKSGLEGIFDQPTKIQVLNLSNPYVFSFTFKRKVKDSFILSLAIKGDTLNLILMYLPEYLRGKNYTPKIFTLLKRWSLEYKFKQITLTSKKEFNPLWLKLGFQPMGDCSFAYRLVPNKESGLLEDNLSVDNLSML